MNKYQSRLVEDAKRLVARYPTRYALHENNDDREHAYWITDLSTGLSSAHLLIRTTDWRVERDYPDHAFELYLRQKLKTNSNDDKWNHRFLRLAQTVSGYSKDPSTKVGAVIVDEDDNVRTIGYNGFPRGVKDTDKRLEDRTLKYPLTVHAELNAICTCARVGVPTKGATMVCTHFPCAPCAGAIVQAGFKDVIVLASSADFDSRWNETNKLATTIFIEGKVDAVVVFEHELKEDDTDEV